MLRNTALASDFKHSHGDPTATESLNDDVIPQKLSLEVNPSAGLRFVGVRVLGSRVLEFRVKGFRI